MEVIFSDNGAGYKAAAKKASEGCFVQKDSVLMEFKSKDGLVGKIKSPCEGVVTFAKNLKRGCDLSNGMVVAVVAECTHGIVIKDMCATCGKDLREKGGRAGERKEQTTANVSMIHHVPELIVSDKLAMEIGSADENNLLTTRKLVLLVDLDQTIIHTSNLPMKIDTEKHPDITRYNLMNGVYTTKLRPHTNEFLEKMAKLFEMHIVTYGQRQYAHRIAQILDPEARIFGQRILSRDELFSAQHKVLNLDALFPCGDNLVVIIDDRADVWMYSEALIQIKPYRFFKEIGDINAPKGSKQELDVQIDDQAHQDRILEEIGRVLTNIHDKYYELHDMKDPDAPLIDVKDVINSERKKVLDGTIIVLSGVVPLNEKIERTDIYRLCLQFGAKVVDSVTDEVTHVVANRWGTSKVHQGEKAGKHVVTVKWLYACVDKWLKADEKLFELNKESTPPSGPPIGTKLIANDLANLSTIGKSALADMNSEVDEALSDDDDEEEDAENGDDAGKSEKKEEKRVALENDRKRKHAPEEEYESSDGDGQDDGLLSYEQLLSKSKKEGRMVTAGDEEDTVFDVDHEAYRASTSTRFDEDCGDNSNDGNEEIEVSDDEDEDFEDMAAMIERQVSGEE